MNLFSKVMVFLICLVASNLQAFDLGPTMLKRDLQAQARAETIIPAQVTGQNGSYILDKKLGNGAFGQVYRAQDESGQTVAIKFFIKSSWNNITEDWPQYHSPFELNQDEKWDPFSFENEWKVGLDLHHPYIVKSLDRGTVLVEGDETDFIVMEFIQGKVVGDYPEKTLTHEDTVRMCLQFLEALRYGVENNYFYYDLHPWNFMITSDKQFKVIDLGSYWDLSLQPFAFSYIGRDFKRVYWIMKELMSKGDKSPQEIIAILAPLKESIGKTKGLFTELSTKQVILDVFAEWVAILQNSEVEAAAA